MKSVSLAILIICVLFVLSSAVPCFSKDYSFDSSLPGSWEINYNYIFEKSYDLGKEEANYCRGKMDKLIEILKEEDLLKSPMGFNAAAMVSYVEPGYLYKQYKPPYSIDIPVQMGLRLRLPALYADIRTEDGKTVAESETSAIYFQYNNLDIISNKCSLSYNPLVDEDGNCIMREPDLIDTVQGYQVYWEGFILLTNGKTPWVPISREHYLKAKLYYYQELSSENNDFVIKYFQDRLNSMSEEEKKSIAFYNSTTDDITGLVPEGERGGSRLVILNPDYFDSEMPRTAVQLITITFNSYYWTKDLIFEEVGHKFVNLELLRNLDYKKIHGLLDE